MINTTLLIDGGETGIYNYVIPYITVTKTSPTNAAVVVATPLTTPASYKVEYSTSPTFATITGTVNTANGIFSLTTLTAGQTYYIRARAYFGANATGAYGPYIVDKFTMQAASTVGTVNNTANSSTTPTNVVDAEALRIYAKIAAGLPLTDAENAYLLSLKNAPSSGNNSNNTGSNSGTSVLGTSVAIKNANTVSRSLFTITKKTSNVNATTDNKVAIAEKDLQISTIKNFYSFGTTLFFKSSTSSVASSGGIGFFTSNNGDTGYFVELQTTDNITTNTDKEVSVYKVVNGKKTRLRDTQSGLAKSFNGLYGGQSYKVDIKVQVQAAKVIINVYVNNLIITATDTTQPNTTNPALIILPKTSKVAMFTSKGETNFDYIYAVPLEEKEYNSSTLLNPYTGQYNKATINFLYGSKVLNNFNTTPVQNGVLEEFGTIARELRKVSIKYNSRPAFPIYPSLGVNSFIEVVGSKLGTFGAEVYLLNNAGTYVPLDDSGMSSFTIIGNYVAASGEYEYTDTLSNEYDNPEPATFDSMWIQTEPDARSISDWIKKQWSKQQIVVSMKVFGNPLISVGDVITVKYPSNDLDGTQKFVVTNVNNSYNEGLETSITCRSIYS